MAAAAVRALATPATANAGQMLTAYLHPRKNPSLRRYQYIRLFRRIQTVCRVMMLANVVFVGFSA